jgi:putative aminopeptidase FrvX
MMSQKTVDLLRELTAVAAPSGYEQPAAEIVKRRLEAISKVEFDRMGNVFCTLEGTAARPRIVLPAHLDEVGLMVTFVDEKGYIRFQTLGGWWSQVLLAQRVNVINSKGEVIPGVVGSKPPHLLSEEERNKVVKLDDLFIDVGATSKDEVEKTLGVVPGDPIVPDSPFTVMAGGRRLLAKAWDDRAGVGLMVRVLEELKDQKHPNTVIGCGTVQEEVGTRGAKTVAATADPDVALVLEVAISADAPGIKPEETQGDMGKGPMLCILDAGMVPHRGLRDFVVQTAKKARIPYQYTSLVRGATDGRELQYAGRGVPALYIGVPCRYIHAHHGVIDGDDFEHTLRLLVEVIKRLDAKAFQTMIGAGVR